MDYIPKVSTLTDTANIPKDPKEPFMELSKEEIYTSIIQYYKRYSDINPSSYMIVGDESSHKMPSTTYKPEDFSYDGFEDLGVSYSNYSYEAMEKAGMDTSDIWNGDSVICVFEDGKFKIGQTDYYTSTIFSRLLYIESANALMEADGEIDRMEKDDFPLRSDMLSVEEELFDTPSFSTGISSGGLLIAEHDNEWKMLFARRSMKPRVNQGMVSVAPNGGVEYTDFKNGDPIKGCLRREFAEELFSSTENGKQFFDEKIEAHQTSIAWNLRSGNVSAGHVMYTDHEAFDRIVNEDQSNFEFSNLIEVPIMDSEEISELMKIGNFSPSVVPLVAESLKHFDQNEDKPSLPYEIRKIS